MVDVLTGGRVTFGVGRGYHTREVETFGAPLLDQNANREMFEDGVEVLFKAFEGEPFSHQGKYWTIPPGVPYRGYTLKEITLVPALQRLPVEYAPLDEFDPRFVPRRGRETTVASQERHIERFRQRYIDRIVGCYIMPQFPHAPQQEVMGVAV